jgi:translation initiation factor 4A
MNKENFDTMNIEKVEVEEVKCYNTFENMPLHPLLIRGIYSYGFEKPSAIQQRAIVPIINKMDLIAQAQSGTGKTGAFTIGTISRLDPDIKKIQAFILKPTRELALQTHEVASKIGEFLFENNPDFCQSFVGGNRVQDDIKKLQNNTILGIGTPGRVLDLLKRGSFNTENMKLLVFDEADEMLSQGFQEQIYEIFRFMPKNIQICLFSATLPKDVLELSQKFLRNPTEILVKQESLSLDGIKQFYINVNKNEKIDVLQDLYEQISLSQSVIFVNMRRNVDMISNKLNENGYNVSSIHADMPKAERDKVMKNFREGNTRVLVTSDLISRGIDVHHVNTVINYDLPNNMENYLHRIGRGGRFGRKGVAINLLSDYDIEKIKELENHYKIKMEELPMDFYSYLELEN